MGNPGGLKAASTSVSDEPLEARQALNEYGMIADAASIKLGF
jgi:hypothetical protein